jgi:hypothetical protein
LVRKANEALCILVNDHCRIGTARAGIGQRGEGRRGVDGDVLRREGASGPGRGLGVEDEVLELVGGVDVEDRYRLIGG